MILSNLQQAALFGWLCCAFVAFIAVISQKMTIFADNYIIYNLGIIK